MVVSDYKPDGQLTQQAIVDHARVVSECFRISTVLPFKFGTVFETDDALRRAVRTNRKTFLDSVAKLRGKAEMHIKLLLKDGSLQEIFTAGALPPTVGSDYLMKLRDRAARERERQTKARALSMQVNKLFSPLEEEISCKRIESGGIVLDIAHLIDSKSIEKYQNRLSSASRQFKNCQVSVSGPWPPYHFLPGSCVRSTTKATNNFSPEHGGHHRPPFSCLDAQSAFRTLPSNSGSTCGLRDTISQSSRSGLLRKFACQREGAAFFCCGWVTGCSQRSSEYI